MSTTKRGKNRSKESARGAPRAVQPTPSPSPPTPWSLAAPWICALLGLLVILVAIPCFGMMHFGGYDHSLMMDATWRMHNGQRPYADFIMTLPPFFYILPVYAVAVLGFHWSTFVYLEALFACIVFLWTLWLATEIFRSWRLAFLLTAVAVACTHILAAFWWHNTSPVAMAAIFLLSCYRFGGAGGPVKFRHALSFVLSLAILLLCKPNVAAAAAVLGVASLMASVPAERRTRRIGLILGLSAIAVLFDVAFLLANRINPWDVYASYQAVSQRGLREFMGTECITRPDMACLALILVPLAILVSRGKMKRQDLFGVCIGLSLLVTGTYAMLTNLELPVVSRPLQIFGVAILMFHPSFTGLFGRRFVAVYLAILVLIGAEAFRLGYVRYRVETVGPGAFYEDTFADKPISDNAVFHGLRSGPRFVRVLDQIRQVLARPGVGKVFFGPRMEFAYSAFGLESPTGLPIWWHPGSSFAYADEAKIVQTWKDKKFDCLICLKYDLTRYPDDFVDYIFDKYAVDDSLSELSVFTRKQR